VSPFLNVTEGENTEFSAFYRAMTLLVVASPCALVLSIPSAILAAIAWGARHGILFRGGAAIEQMADLKVVALDKTGTLTTGDLRVVSVESFPAGHERAPRPNPPTPWNKKRPTQSRGPLSNTGRSRDSLCANWKTSAPLRDRACRPAWATKPCSSDGAISWPTARSDPGCKISRGLHPG
jgi:magnesium-transporting ATPase (P-type)